LAYSVNAATFCQNTYFTNSSFVINEGFNNGSSPPTGWSRNTGNVNFNYNTVFYEGNGSLGGDGVGVATFPTQIETGTKTYDIMMRYTAGTLWQFDYIHNNARVVIYSNKVQYYDGSAWTALYSALANTWYRIIWSINYDADTYDVYVLNATTGIGLANVTGKSFTDHSVDFYQLSLEVNEGQLDLFRVYNGTDCPLNASTGGTPFSLTIELSSPANGTLNNTNNMSYLYNITTSSLTNVTRCQLFTNSTGGALIYNATNSTALSATNNIFSNIYISNDIKYIWRVGCNVTNGTTYYSATYNHKVDNSTPTVTINYPANNTRINTSTYKLNASGYDMFLDMMNFTFYNVTNNITYTNTTSTLTSPYYSYNHSQVFSYDNDYLLEVCARDSATYSPPKPLYTATTEGFGIRFRDLETDNDITMSISIYDKGNGRPISITDGRGAKVNITMDGTHIKYGGTIKINNLNEAFRLVYHSNNPTKRFIPKSYLPAQFITSDYGLYFHHQDLVKHGFTITKSFLNATSGDYVVEFTNNFVGIVEFDPISGGLHIICSNIRLYVDFQNPTAVFYTMSPTELVLTSFIAKSGINITFNFSDYNLNNDSAIMYYKANDSTSNYMYFQNGTGHSGYFTTTPDRGNETNRYTFNLKDNQVLPGIYNYGEVTLENTPHIENSTFFTTSNAYLSMEFLNISNTKQYGFLEFMVNRTGGTGLLHLYYCNSSYGFSSPIVSNNNCYNFFNTNATDYDHTHTIYSSHMVVPFSINTTTGKAGTVYVTGTGYFIILGNGGTNFSFYYINANVSRPLVFRTSANAGTAWTDLTYQNMTIDAHLHQFGINSSLWVYACANDTYNHTNCTTPRQDLFGLGGLPPSAPDVYEPTTDHGNYTGNIYTNWTPSISPNGSAINYYNVSLYWSNDTKVIELRGNVSTNLSYLFNISNYSDGEYYTYVQAYDTIGFTSYGVSDYFTTDKCVWYVANTSWGNWANLSCAGLGNQYRNSTRNYTLYENVSCGEFANISYYEYQLNQSLVNTSLGTVANNSCQGTYRNITQNLTQYDDLRCADNTTFTNSTLLNIWENTTLGLLNNQSCVGIQRNMSQNLTQYDGLRCGDNTTFINSTLYDPSYANTSLGGWANISDCQFNDTVQQARNLTQYDNYLCAPNTTFYEYQAIVCNYAPPSINIIYPKPITYTSIVDALNYSASDFTGVDYCWYNINTGANSTPMKPCINVTNITTIYGWNISAFDGSNTWTVYANDTFGALGSVTWTFYVGFGAIGSVSDCIIYNFGYNKGVVYSGNCEQCRYRKFGYYDDGGVTIDCI
jgi:hypothetical protein